MMYSLIPFTPGDLGSREDVLWTIGWDQLVREERHKLCIGLATDRMEVIAGKNTHHNTHGIACRI
jgi:hypothetical protein